MPPAAISRSSTYLPKIWGNTPFKSSALLFALLVSGCGPDKEPDEIREIRAYYCGPDAGGSSVDILLDAVGDFEASTLTSEAVADTDVDLDLPFPVKTRGVTAEGESGQKRWTGVGLLGNRHDIAFSLWPVRDACLMFEPSEERPFPRNAVGTALGYLPERSLLLLTGSDFPDGAPSGALAIDLDRGTHTSIADIGTPLAYATITPFGPDALLVAGGEDPANDVSPGDDARVFDADTLEFQGQLIKLKKGRSHHGAISLASGETLLVGGIVDSGEPIPPDDPILELVSPKDRTSREEGLAKNLTPRVLPTVLRLTDDRVFIGGGFDGPDTGAAPTGKLEWLRADASHLEKTIDVWLATAHAFAPLPGGGVLAVGACAKLACATDLELRRKSAIWIGPDYQVVDLPTAILAPLVFARLVSAADGAPWLFARTEKPNRDAWLVFNPWTGSFDQPVNEPLTGPIQELAATEHLPPPVAIDPGLFVWLEQTGDALGKHARVVGFRFSTRNIYSRQLGSLLSADTTHIAPSIPPFGGSGLEYDQSLLLSGPTLESPTGLHSVATVADTTYADVDFQFETAASCATPCPSALPQVVFAGAVLGSAACPWPAGEGGTRLSVSRRGSQVTLGRDGHTTTCSVTAARSSIALAGPEDPAACKHGNTACSSASECCSSECTSQKLCTRSRASVRSLEIQRR